MHEQPDLFEAPEGETIALDYQATGLTLRRHPLALLRGKLERRGWKSPEQLAQLKDGAAAWACGIVTMRQQRETARGVIFVTLEDETGCVNVIVWRHVRERQCPTLLRSRLLAVTGQWQPRDRTTHLVMSPLEFMQPARWMAAMRRPDPRVPGQQWVERVRTAYLLRCVLGVFLDQGRLDPTRNGTLGSRRQRLLVAADGTSRRCQISTCSEISSASSTSIPR